MSILTLPSQYTNANTDTATTVYKCPYWHYSTVTIVYKFHAPHMKVTWNSLLLLPSTSLHYRSQVSSNLAWNTDGPYQKDKRSKPGNLQEFFRTSGCIRWRSSYTGDSWFRRQLNKTYGLPGYQLLHITAQPYTIGAGRGGGLWRQGDEPHYRQWVCLTHCLNQSLLTQFLIVSESF